MWNTLLREHSREFIRSRLCFLYLFPLSKADIRNPLRYLLMNAVTSRPAFKIPDTLLYEQTVPGIFYF